MSVLDASILMKTFVFCIPENVLHDLQLSYYVSERKIQNCDKWITEDTNIHCSKLKAYSGSLKKKTIKK